jgi:hypothetical protein
MTVVISSRIFYIYACDALQYKNSHLVWSWGLIQWKIVFYLRMEHPDMLNASAEKAIDCQSQLYLDDSFQ